MSYTAWMIWQVSTALIFRPTLSALNTSCTETSRIDQLFLDSQFTSATKAICNGRRTANSTVARDRP